MFSIVSSPASSVACSEHAEEGNYFTLQRNPARLGDQHASLASRRRARRGADGCKAIRGTGGGTRRVRLVREGGTRRVQIVPGGGVGGGHARAWRRSRTRSARPRPGRGSLSRRPVRGSGSQSAHRGRPKLSARTKRVRSVRGEGRGVSGWYGGSPLNFLSRIICESVASTVATGSLMSSATCAICT